MLVSPTAVNFIMNWEEFRPVIYRDVGGVPTFGYGHVHNGHHKITLTRKEALELLHSDLNQVAKEVSAVIKVPLTQHQFDAMMSFEFNTGQLRESTMLKRLNEHQFENAINVELGRWVYSKGKKIRGLVNRRNAERKLFLTKDE